jgi:hypothetical protein
MNQLSVIGALVALAGFTGAPSVLGATTPQRLSTHSAGPSCNLASAKRVKSALGITVGAPLVTRNGPVTVCQFMSKTALLVRFQTNETTALFAYGRKSFAQHGELTKPVGGLGTTAYSSTFGGASTIVVLQGKTELLITSTESLAKVEALAKLILPSL